MCFPFFSVRDALRGAARRGTGAARRAELPLSPAPCFTHQRSPRACTPPPKVSLLLNFFGVMFPCSHGLWGSTVPAQQPGSPWQAGFDVPLGWDKGLVAASPCQRPVPPFRRTLPPLLSIIARCHSPFCVTQQNSRQLFPSRLARPGVLFMTLSSSLVGLRPAGDLPPNLRHAACPARRRWQGKGLGKQLPNPAAASLIPGSQADVVQLGAPTLRSWGPGDRACCRSRPRSQQHGDVPRCPVPLQREPPQLQSTTGPGTAPCGHGGEAGRRRPRAPGGAELMEQLLAGRCHPRSASGYPSRAEVTA